MHDSPSYGRHPPPGAMSDRPKDYRLLYIPYVCGYCYTQVTDVQQEINGLMDIDRNFKVDADVLKEINERQVGYWRSMYNPPEA